MDIKLIIILLTSFVGGLLYALSGWASTTPPEPFNLRKTIVAVIVALVAGGVYSTSFYTPSGDIIKDIIVALIFTAGGSVAVHQAVTSIQANAINNLNQAPSAPAVKAKQIVPVDTGVIEVATPKVESPAPVPIDTPK